MRMQIALATVVIAMLLLAAEAPAAFIWDGGGATGDWADADNWAGGVAPATTTTEMIYIDMDQIIGTSVLDQDRTVGGVYFYEGVQTPHTFDLGGKTLTLTGKWQTDGGTSDPRGGIGTITNGTLKFGSGSSISLEAYQSAGKGILQFSADGSGSIETAGLGIISGGGYSTYSTLDLRNATVVGGTFEASGLNLGSGTQIRFADSTKMSKVYFRQTVQIEGNHKRQDTKADIPGGVDLQIGVDASTRGKIRIGHTVAQKNGDGYMDALGTGGVFTAYVDEFLVGRGNSGATNSFDMTLMDSAMVDASTADVEIGTAGTGDGMVGLPSGTATFGSLTVGQASDGAGLLRLAGTDLTVLGDLVIGATGSVDLISGSGLGNITVLAGGSLTINGDVLGAGTYSSADYPDHITGSGTITLVPEPGTLALLGLGGLLRRRRR